MVYRAQQLIAHFDQSNSSESKEVQFTTLNVQCSISLPPAELFRIGFGWGETKRSQNSPAKTDALHEILKSPV